MNRNRKCVLGLVALVSATVAMSGCDQAVAADDGTVFTYTDANGNRTNYTAADLLKSYQSSGSNASTQFDKVYEVLIRHYYETTGKASLARLESDATQEVIKDKQTAQSNADSNGTSYETEFESILNSNGVDNVSELWEHHLYQKEKDAFEDDLYDNFNLGSSSGVNGYEALRDGSYYLNGTKKNIFDFTKTEYGDVQDSWLLDQMPYEVRHILVKLSSGSSKEYTQDKISEPTSVSETGECTKISTILMGLAGATLDGSGKLVSVGEGNVNSFDYMSRYSDDDGSKAAYGEYSKSGYGPMTKDQNSELVHGFILGVYAFESLYNQRNLDSTKNAYGAANAYRITPGLTQDATSASDVDSTQYIYDENGEKVTVNEYFNDLGIGQIPFGAVMALSDAGKITTDDSSSAAKVNGGQEQFYPRNVIYNKYFNKHQVCVITPNTIGYNAVKNFTTKENKATWASEATINEATTVLNSFYDSANDKITDLESDTGVYCEQFGTLPGFSTDTTNVLPQFANNVLTDSDGEIILAVRAGASSYQGIHFMTIKRSALSQYGTKVVSDGSKFSIQENTLSDVGTMSATTGKISYTANSASLSDYYSIYTPDSSNYPTVGSDALSTYVNFNVHQTSDYSERAGNISNAIKSAFSSNISTYMFQYLVENGSIKFADTSLEATIANYSKTKRMATSDDAFETWSNNWKEYAEEISAQNEERAIGYTEADKTAEEIGSKSSLISEACAVGYGNPSKNSDLWKKGGACYYDTGNE